METPVTGMAIRRGHSLWLAGAGGSGAPGAGLGRGRSRDLLAAPSGQGPPSLALHCSCSIVHRTQVSWCILIHRGGECASKCLELEWTVPRKEGVSSPSGEVPKQVGDNIIKLMHSGQPTLGWGRQRCYVCGLWSWSEL